jgi:hypothetical protein
MKLPSRMLDLSVPLDNETVLDPPNMRPRIDYKTNKENAWMLLESFPGLEAYPAALTHIEKHACVCRHGL